MTRRTKTIAVLTLEVCLLAAMFASFAYFVRDSRDFLAQRPQHPSVSAPVER
jgi:hypothetical protein